MRKRLKEIYDHSTLVAKIRYSYLCLLVPFVLFLIFCFYNLWNNNRRYEDMVNSSVMASQFSLDFQKDFDYETYLLIVGNKTLEESSLHAMLEEADEIVAGLEELTESQENRKRLTSVKKYLNNLGTYIGRIEDNIREGNRYEDNIEIWENDVQIVTSLVGDTMSQYIYYEIRGIQESRQQYQDFFVNMIRFSVIAFALILMLCLFLSYYIPLSITRPIRRLTQVTDQVAKGDLTVRSDVTGGLEARVLSDSMNTMILEKLWLLAQQDKRQLYAYFDEKEVFVFGYRAQQLCYANTFPADVADNAVYFILSVWKDLKMDVRQEECILLGNGNIKDDTAQLLARYLQNVRNTNAADIYRRSTLARNQQLPFDLLALWVHVI